MNPACDETNVGVKKNSMSCGGTRRGGADSGSDGKRRPYGTMAHTKQLEVYVYVFYIIEK